jgi:hypothetical protein
LEPIAPCPEQDQGVADIVAQDAMALYQEHYVDKDFQRLDLFQLLTEQYGIVSALYPGSFVHITPSLVYPVTTYVETDARAKAFFADPAVHAFIDAHKTYDGGPEVTFHAADYRNDFGEPAEHYDLLISQYAGFVSQPCKRYLKIGGLLLANNSHGDASMASIDDDYVLVATVNRRRGEYRLSERNLDAYFVPKAAVKVTRECLEKLGRGIGHTKSAGSYVFRRVG